MYQVLISNNFDVHIIYKVYSNDPKLEFYIDSKMCGNGNWSFHISWNCRAIFGYRNSNVSKFNKFTSIETIANTERQREKKKNTFSTERLKTKVKRTYRMKATAASIEYMLFINARDRTTCMYIYFEHHQNIPLCPSRVWVHKHTATPIRVLFAYRIVCLLACFTCACRHKCVCFSFHHEYSIGFSFQQNIFLLFMEILLRLFMALSLLVLKLKTLCFERKKWIFIDFWTKHKNH